MKKIVLMVGLMVLCSCIAQNKVKECNPIVANKCSNLCENDMSVSCRELVPYEYQECTCMYEGERVSYIFTSDCGFTVTKATYIWANGDGMPYYDYDGYKISECGGLNYNRQNRIRRSDCDDLDGGCNFPFNITLI